MILVLKEVPQMIAFVVQYLRARQTRPQKEFQMEIELQDLINSGTAWKLEGSVGRAAMEAIEAGE